MEEYWSETLLFQLKLLGEIGGAGRLIETRRCGGRGGIRRGRMDGWSEHLKTFAGLETQRFSLRSLLLCVSLKSRGSRAKAQRREGRAGLVSGFWFFAVSAFVCGKKKPDRLRLKEGEMGEIFATIAGTAD
jgi:hypothetical protein